MKNDQKTINHLKNPDSEIKIQSRENIMNVYVSYQEESLSTQSKNCERFLMLRKLFEVNIYTCMSAMI